MLTRREIVAAAGLALIAERARAQGGYSDRPIRILVGYPAGGGVDIVARLFAEPMKATLGQSVIVENRAGASAMIAAGAVAKSPPDGLTLLMAASGEVAINQHLYREKMSYDPLRELAPVALVGIVPCVVVVAAQTPVRTAAELIAYARANRGKLSFSSSGIGNPQQLAGELMNSMAGTDVLHVPYRGSAPAVTDVATGAVTMSFSSLAAALPLMQDGRLRAVAVTSRERMPQRADRARCVRRCRGNCRPRTESSPGWAWPASSAPMRVRAAPASRVRTRQGAGIGGASSYHSSLEHYSLGPSVAWIRRLLQRGYWCRRAAAAVGRTRNCIRTQPRETGIPR